jgi:hypothetical protein
MPAVFTTGDPAYQFGILYSNNTVTSREIHLKQVAEPVTINENN